MREQTRKQFDKSAEAYAFACISAIIQGHKGQVFMRSDTKDTLKKHYFAGAEGYVNSLWRDIEDELPRKKDKILVLRDGQVVVGEEPYLGSFTMTMGLVRKITSFHNGDKWCYIDDILPTYK